ncbi:unnamed protein product [Adineta steineri]|uniref:Uncharacterized protein n=1 Tax=Adineta steineri TaxID=433720 RepID=A0A813WMQ4_9BILA|nr:unnamed protein product [Adineta steineri]CAF3856494.1 unnamed protein product [Adineta steineri]
MNFANMNISCQSSSTINLVEHVQKQRRNKFILIISIVIAIICFISTLIMIIIYVATRRQGDTHPIIIISNTSLYSCINQSVEYITPQKPFFGYSQYRIDASSFSPETLITLKITIYPPNIGCTWSFDVYPMDGRIIPISEHIAGSVFSHYDLKQDSTVEFRNIGILKDWGAETGKFIVAIDGAWYGTAGVGCKGYGLMTVCFSSPGKLTR